MTFLRPAATKTLSRWAETIAFGLGFCVFAFLAIRATGVILPMVYGAITVVMATMLFVAIRRARVSGDIAVNSGHVQIDERQITYFHLGQSWSVSVNDLTSVVIETTNDGPSSDDLYWVIRDLFGSVVRIPNTAGGNEQLFDAVSALNGVSFEQITTAMSSTSPAIFTVWRGK
jgi:hypothetical protein